MRVTTEPKRKSPHLLSTTNIHRLAFFYKNLVFRVGIKVVSDGSQLVLPLRGHDPRYLGQEVVKWAMMILLQLGSNQSH